VSAKLLTLAPTALDATSALNIIDDLRAKVESGKVIAFFACGFSADDENYVWSATTRPATRLRMMGSMSNALWAMHNGDVSSDE